jgi:ABC-type iron transport system FetAB permease component
MLGPFPWQIDSIKDLVVFFESVFRALLIIGFIVNYYKSSNKSNLLLLFIVYLSLTLFWSIATTNYGQAIRHHVLSGWIIILIGTPGLIILFKLIFMRKITNNG